MPRSSVRSSAWGSYWSFEAFEERRLEQIDHLSGAMGTTVHARFDDDLERNNGVVTFTYLPGGNPDDAVIEINVQQGSIAVTNPDPTQIELPEIVRVTRRNGSVETEFIAGSTLLDAGQRVLDDAAISELVDQTAAVAEVWRGRLNASLAAEQQVQTVVLDFEFKTMEAGWPMLIDESKPYPSRLVLRQVRSLDPGLRGVPDEVRALPIPRDVLMRAALVESVSCVTDAAQPPVQRLEVITNALVKPDMGYDDVPLVIGAPSPAGATCTRQILFASPEQSPIALVTSGAAFVIIG